jgi:adenosylcobyric acid synthase
MQAHACGITPSVALNPVLLKPGSDRTSQVVVRGKADGQVSALSYRERKVSLFGTVLATLSALRSEFDVVVCEGAGSPAEINLRADDIANMGLAQAAGLPVIVVGDIDRGGVFAHLYGTLALLSPADQELVAGFVINKFRGDPALLAPGLTRLAELTRRPVFGVLPWDSRVWLDAEDSLSYSAEVGRPSAPLGSQWLRVGVVRFPRISNGTDVDALAVEPGVSVRLVTSPAGLADVDLVVLPGSKATVADLSWLRETGLAAAVVAHHAAGRPVLGICGGFQMLCSSLDDRVESRAGAVSGLGLVDVDISFTETKTLRNPEGSAFGAPARGYEIHHGQVVRRGTGLPGLVATPDGPEGVLAGGVAGTHWHGLLENDLVRRGFLSWAAECAGRSGFVAASDVSFAAVREGQLDLLGDLVGSGLDMDSLGEVIGVSARRPGGPSCG